MYYFEEKGTFRQWSYVITIPEEVFGIEYGFFEYWDKETDGDECYEDGDLIFEDGELFDYAGVKVLPDFIIKEISKHRKVNL
tara:strand:- start:421 stop:666 length:246 start_codon:yes stop_codon:yes gene_type:complete